MKSTRNKTRHQPAVILGFAPSGDPILPIFRLTRTQWAIICPFCGAEHWHGRGAVDGNNYGSRASHCVDGPGGLGYVAAMPSPALLEAARQQRPRRA